MRCTGGKLGRQGERNALGAPAQVAGCSARRCSAPQVRGDRAQTQQVRSAFRGRGISASQLGVRLRQVWGVRCGRSWSELGPSQLEAIGGVTGPDPALRTRPTPWVRPGAGAASGPANHRGLRRVNFYLLSREANGRGWRGRGRGERKMARTTSGSPGSDPGRAGRHGSGRTQGSAAGRWR